MSDESNRISFVTLNATEQYDFFINKYKSTHKFEFQNFNHDIKTNSGTIQLLVMRNDGVSDLYAGEGKSRKECIKKAKEKFILGTKLQVPLNLQIRSESKILNRQNYLYL